MTERHTPASDHPHVTEGICTCVHVGLTRVPVPNCGLSAHRVETVSTGRHRAPEEGPGGI